MGFKPWTKPKPTIAPQGLVTQTVRESVVRGDRRIDAGCVDVGKREAYYALKRRYPAWRVNELTTFLVEHDFQRDMKYLELTRKLTYLDIEFAKRVASGDTVSEMYEHMTAVPGKRPARIAFSIRLQRAEVRIKPLVEYFRELLGQTRDPDSFSVEEAFRSLVLDVRAAKPGKERFELTLKLTELCGLHGKLKEYGRKKYSDMPGEELDLEAVQRMAASNGR